MLQSDFVEAAEEKILEALVAWSDGAAGPFSTGAADGRDRAAELLPLVRLPIVPCEAAAMREASSRGLVKDEQLKVLAITM